MKIRDNEPYYVKDYSEEINDNDAISLFENKYLGKVRPKKNRSKNYKYFYGDETEGMHAKQTFMDCDGEYCKFIYMRKIKD